MDRQLSKDNFVSSERELKKLKSEMEEFFIVNGLGAPAEYPLLQITSVHSWKDYIYIYTGGDKAVILRSDGVEGGKARELVAFLKQRQGIRS